MHVAKNCHLQYDLQEAVVSCFMWVLGFGALVFPLHVWLCHGTFILLHADRSGPRLRGVWLHFLLNAFIFHPLKKTSPSSLFREKTVLSLMDTDAPVLIRNEISQYLTASVWHRLGYKKKTLSTIPSQMFEESDLNRFNKKYSPTANKLHWENSPTSSYLQWTKQSGTIWTFNWFFPNSTKNIIFSD